MRHFVGKAEESWAVKAPGCEGWKSHRMYTPGTRYIGAGIYEVQGCEWASVVPPTRLDEVQSMGIQMRQIGASEPRFHLNLFLKG